MTIRIVVREDDATMSVNCGSLVQSYCKTFDIEAPELEKFLRQAEGYVARTVTGAEILP